MKGFIVLRITTSTTTGVGFKAKLTVGQKKKK